MRNDLKDQTGIYFQMEDVAESLCQVIKDKIDFPKPRLKVKRKIASKSEPVIEKIVT